ncbi:hypothetical protein CU019_0748 [Enterococcus faecium]|nr:hypothetical protein [Enterococcus faecium]MBK4797949.1 hypothetical protein [Enterococcus faecium]MBK4819251.1 hypothetical protein [Enterococcus faecium]MBK4832021.1 hypothetical protein [Enterococcus faecium]
MNLLAWLSFLLCNHFLLYNLKKIKPLAEYFLNLFTKVFFYLSFSTTQLI